MIDFSGSLTQIKKSELELMRRIANADPLLTQEELDKWLTVSDYTDILGDAQTSDHLIVSLIKIPNMMDNEDKLPRFIKSISPRINYTTGKDNLLRATDIPVDASGRRRVGKIYMGSTLNSYGYHYIEKSNAVNTIVEPMIKLFFMTKDSEGNFIQSSQTREVQEDIGGVEEPAYVQNFKFTETRDLYIGIGFEYTQLGALTDYQIEAMVESAPSYITLRNKVNYLPMRGFYHKDGYPISATYIYPLLDGYSDVYGFIRLLKLTRQANDTSEVDGLFTYRLDLPQAQGVFEPFDSTNTVPNALTWFTSYFLSKSGSVKTVDYYQTLINTATSALERALKESDSFAVSYFRGAREAFVRIQEYIKNDVSLEEAWDIFYSNVDDRALNDTSYYDYDKAFPPDFETRADLIFSLGFENDYEIEDFDNYSNDEEKTQVVAYDLSRNNPNEVVYDEQAIKQSVENIIFTALNEYIFQDDFGIDFDARIFELNTINLGDLEAEILRQIERYEGLRLVVTSEMIDIEISPTNPNTLNINVYGIIRSTAKMFTINQELTI